MAHMPNERPTPRPSLGFQAIAANATARPADLVISRPISFFVCGERAIWAMSLRCRPQRRNLSSSKLASRAMFLRACVSWLSRKSSEAKIGGPPAAAARNAPRALQKKASGTWQYSARISWLYASYCSHGRPSTAMSKSMNSLQSSSSSGPTLCDAVKTIQRRTLEMSSPFARPGGLPAGMASAASTLAAVSRIFSAVAFHAMLIGGPCCPSHSHTPGHSLVALNRSLLPCRITGKGGLPPFQSHLESARTLYWHCMV
mmetsp:Transcript_17152/g.45399  ORF Transcript_17152/g.45399 Transcript_17152/m.45399 type:complete len:258 (-) Transcript_17152:444-1217(-)